MDYTPTLGKKLKIRASINILYGIILIGFGIFDLIILDVYSVKYNDSCQYGNIRSSTYAVIVMNLFFGLLITISGNIYYRSIKAWANGDISNTWFRLNIHREYQNGVILTLAILQISAFGFASSSSEFKNITPDGCDPLLYYSLLINIYLCYNITLTLIVLYICLYICWLILACIIEIFTGYINSCVCCDNVNNESGRFGLFGRNSARIAPRPTSRIPHRLVDPVNGSRQSGMIGGQSVIINIPAKSNVNPPLDCPVCLDPQDGIINFKNCQHWVCDICWARLMDTNPICPLCRKSIN